MRIYLIKFDKIVETIKGGRVEKLLNTLSLS